MQSQLTFNRVPEKVPGGFGVEPGQVQQGSGEGSGEGLRGLSTHANQAEAASQHASERLVKIQPFGCWGYHRSLFIFPYIGNNYRN